MEQTQSESIDELAKAMVKVQLGLPGAKASVENTFYKNKYANLADCMQAGREILSANGLCVLQTLGGTAETPSVITTLIHESGQWIKGEGFMTPDKKGPQAIGSCITYGRRYGYSAIIGLHQEDDDGEGATDRKKKKQAPKDTSKAGVDDIPLGDGPAKITKQKAGVLYAKLKAVIEKEKWNEGDEANFMDEIGFDSVYVVTTDKFDEINNILSKKLEAK